LVHMPYYQKVFVNSTFKWQKIFADLFTVNYPSQKYQSGNLRPKTNEVQNNLLFP